MKFEYVKPELEELELALEGSFLGINSVGFDKGDKEVNDENEDIWD